MKKTINLDKDIGNQVKFYCCLNKWNQFEKRKKNKYYGIVTTLAFSSNEWYICQEVKLNSFT